MSQAATRTIANRIIGKEPAAAVAREIALVTRVPRSLGRAAPTRGSSRVSLSFTDTPHLHAEPVWWPTPPRAAQPPDTLHDLGRTSLGSAYRRKWRVPVVRRPCHRKRLHLGGDMS